MSKTSVHGSATSYVIGFLLSLICTAIPYDLVVNKRFAGKTLLVTILGFAVIQMAIQVLFFLHLGRGPKPLYNVVFFLFTVGTILVVVGGSIFIMNNLHYNMTPLETTTKLAQDENLSQVSGDQTGACQGTRENHQITIRNGIINPVHVDANRCDTLTFLNEDDKARKIIFGSQGERRTYGGEQELSVPRGRGKTITLNEAGTHKFQDSNDLDVTGDFTVNP